MKTIVILVHGYNVMDAGETVGKLRPFFEARGVMVESFNYGFVPFTWQVTKRNPKEAEALASRANYWSHKGYKVIVAGHSNGVTITHLATKDYRATIDICVAINPALEVHRNPAPKAEAVYVWHNAGDRPVMWSVWLRKIFKGVRARPWGAMGNIGYRGGDENVTNIDAGRFDPKADGHSDIFSKEKAPHFLPLIASVALGLVD